MGRQDCHLRYAAGNSSSMRWPDTEVKTISHCLPCSVKGKQKAWLYCELRATVLGQCHRLPDVCQRETGRCELQSRLAKA